MFGIEGRSDHPETLLTAAQSLSQITQGSYHDANFALGVYCIFNAMDASECAGGGPQAVRIQARSYVLFGFAMGDITLHRIANFYIRRAEKCLEREPNIETRAWTNFVRAVYLSGQGQWQRCNDLLDDAVRLSDAAGSLRLWGEASEFKVYALYLQSRFAEAMTVLESAIQVATRDGYIHAIGRAYIAKSLILLFQGKTHESMSYYKMHERSIDASLELGDQTVSEIAVQGFLMAASIRDENWAEALPLADNLTTLVTHAQTISFLLMGEAAAPAELYLTLWEKQGDASYRPRAQAMLKMFHRKYARYYVIGQPLEDTYRCWYAWLSGDERQARIFGTRAIQAARTFQMPYYEALACYHLGRFMLTSDPQRDTTLTAAISLFDQVGATYDAEQARLQQWSAALQRSFS